MFRRPVGFATRHGETLAVALVCRPQLLRLGLERLLGEAGFRVTSSQSLFTPPRPAAVAILCEREEPALEALCREAAGTLADELLVVFHAPTPEAVLDCVAAGARGFVGEHDRPHELVHAIEVVSAGDYHLAPGVLSLLLDWHRASRRSRGARARDRDRDLLGLLASGETTAAIAARLGIAPKTVRNRSSLLYRRLGVRSRAGAAKAAEERGLLD